MSPLARTIEALLFLSPDPVSAESLAEATGSSADDVGAALEELAAAFSPGERGLLLRELAGGWTLVSAPETEDAARQLLAKPRTPPLTPAQAETLAIVAYLQPVSRPEITRIRGVSADSASGTLLERGLIEESGRSQFGAVLYRTTPVFLKLFGMAGLADLPEPGQWDPSPDEEAELRDRLLKAGDLRSGVAVAAQPGLEDEEAGEALAASEDSQLGEGLAVSTESAPGDGLAAVADDRVQGEGTAHRGEFARGRSQAATGDLPDEDGSKSANAVDSEAVVAAFPSSVTDFSGHPAA